MSDLQVRATECHGRPSLTCILVRHRRECLNGVFNERLHLRTLRHQQRHLLGCDRLGCCIDDRGCGTHGHGWRSGGVAQCSFGHHVRRRLRGKIRHEGGMAV